MLRKIFSLKCQKYVKIFCADTQNTKRRERDGEREGERAAEKANEMFENGKKVSICLSGGTELNLVSQAEAVRAGRQSRLRGRQRREGGR